MSDTPEEKSFAAVIRECVAQGEVTIERDYFALHALTREKIKTPEGLRAVDRAGRVVAAWVRGELSTSYCDREVSRLLGCSAEIARAARLIGAERATRTRA